MENKKPEEVINDFCNYCKDNNINGLIVMSDNNQIKHAAFATAPLLGTYLSFLKNYYYNRYSSSYLELLMFISNLFGIQQPSDTIRVPQKSQEEIQIV